MVFYSPIVHTPQQGRQLTARYLSALQVFFGTSPRYVRAIVGASDAHQAIESQLLEFETEIEGIQVNGLDLIAWNDDGRLTEFKVMPRPLIALAAVHQRMAAVLHSATQRRG